MDYQLLYQNTSKQKNIYEIREIHDDTIRYYGDDAGKYDSEHKLKIEKIYSLLPSTIANKVKRFRYRSIESNSDARYDQYVDEFDYLVSSGIALDASAISNPVFPLIQSSKKNLIKLYMNDVGLLTDIIYKTNINAVLQSKSSVNLGAVYETAVAQELKCHNHQLYYFDSKKLGEVDFMIDDYDSLSVVPIEIKSGKNYNNFKAIPKLVENRSYTIKRGYVLSNNREYKIDGKIIHAPIYDIMFL